jgi:hypothetical protein
LRSFILAIREEEIDALAIIHTRVVDRYLNRDVAFRRRCRCGDYCLYRGYGMLAMFYHGGRPPLPQTSLSTTSLPVISLKYTGLVIGLWCSCPCPRPEELDECGSEAIVYPSDADALYPRCALSA